MSEERWGHLERLFEAAAKLGGADRATFLQRACGADDELRRDLERMLRAVPSSSFLEPPAVSETLRERGTPAC